MEEISRASACWDHWHQHSQRSQVANARVEFQPVNFVMQYSAKGEFESGTFARAGGEKPLAFRNRERARDVTPADVSPVGQRLTRAAGLNLINGRERRLDFAQDGNNLVLRGILVEDFPVLARFS